MKEIYGDAWDIFANDDFQILCITTNASLRSNGNGIMGAGIALEARNRMPDIEESLGQGLRLFGNIPFRLAESADQEIWSFPVKEEWTQKADIDLIVASCISISEYFKDQTVNILLPRPGCRRGNLKWKDVKKVIEPLLSDKFSIVHFKEEPNDYL